MNQYDNNLLNQYNNVLLLVHYYIKSLFD